MDSQDVVTEILRDSPESNLTSGRIIIEGYIDFARHSNRSEWTLNLGKEFGKEWLHCLWRIGFIIKGNFYIPVLCLDRELITLPRRSNVPLWRVEVAQKTVLYMIHIREGCKMGLNGFWETSGAVASPDPNGSTEWAWKLDVYGTVGRAGRKSDSMPCFAVDRLYIVLTEKYYD